MRRLLFLAFVTRCGHPATSPSVPLTPPNPSVSAQIVTALTPPAIRRSATIQFIDATAVELDDAGVAWQTASPKFIETHWIPFSEPVDDLVFIREFPHPRNVPGAQLGTMFCGRTLTKRLECVIDYAATPSEPQRVHRFQLPTTGPVEHIGVYTPWLPQGGPDKAICVTANAPSCWSFDWEGTRAEQYTLDAATAEAAALRIAPEARLAWQQAGSLPSANIAEIVQTDRTDLGRVTGTDAEIAVYCARLTTNALSCFGPGVYGELGDGALSVTRRASRPLGDAPVVDVGAAQHHVCAVLADGRVACWGSLYDRMPLPKRPKPTPLPACPLDRSASTAKFNAALSIQVTQAKECASSCHTGERDACLNCVVACITVPYLFRHDAVCQEPLIGGSLAQRGETCFSNDRPARWLTDAELRNDTPEVNLTLSPVFLAGITDAVSVATYGPLLCVVRRDGSVSCLDDNGKLAPRR